MALYARKQRFYQEYADRELARIVVSLLKEQRGLDRSSNSISEFGSKSNRSNSHKIVAQVSDDSHSQKTKSRYSDILTDNLTIDDEEVIQGIMRKESLRLNTIFGQSRQSRRVLSSSECVNNAFAVSRTDEDSSNNSASLLHNQ